MQLQAMLVTRRQTTPANQSPAKGNRVLVRARASESLASARAVLDHGV